MKNQIWKKLTSRKLWVAIAGIATGLALVFGGDSGEITDVAGAVTAVASIVAYIFAEGKIDAAGAKNNVINAENDTNSDDGGAQDGTFTV